MKLASAIFAAVLWALLCPMALHAQDVELDYSTYLGGSGDSDYGAAIDVDSDSCAYVSGVTTTYDFPTFNPYQSSINEPEFWYDLSDVFVVKLSSSGSNLVYATYLGGVKSDTASGICLDAARQAYVVGWTTSTDFPLRNPYQSNNSLGYNNAFVVKLSASGSNLLYATLLGGEYSDEASSICLDSINQIYITGTAFSEHFPLKNPYQSTKPGGAAAFVSKFSSSGSSLVYSTYLGGAEFSYAKGICVDTAQQAYVVGYTSSTDFPVQNPYQSSNNGYANVFVTKFSSSGSALVYSTYLGGGNWGGDYARGICLDSEGHAFIAGDTYSWDFPTVNPYQSTLDNYALHPDAFVVKLTSSGSSLIYSTYLGGGGKEVVYGGIAVDSANRVYVAGFTWSDDFPLINPCQTCDKDTFVSLFSPSGSSLVYSTCLGGAGDYDQAWALCVDSENRAYVTGMTDSDDFPTRNAYQASYAGDYDAFISRLSWGEGPPTPTPVGPVCTPTPVQPAGVVPPGDFDGDGTSDIALYRPSSGLWAVKGISRQYFGGASDQPVAQVYLSDARWDMAIFRPTAGLWAVNGGNRVYFGTSGDDTVQGDFNGDGLADIGIFRSAAGLWAVQGVTRIYFGSGSDIPVPGDYNGDGVWDVGIFRPASGLWAVSGITRAYFGSSADEPVAGDYNGDGVWDIAIFRPAAGLWAVKDGARNYFGSGSDEPIRADFNGDGLWDIGIFREAAGLWAIKGVTWAYFGTVNDIPANTQLNP